MTNQSTVKKGKHLKKMHLKDGSRGMESRDGGAIGEEEKFERYVTLVYKHIYVDATTIRSIIIFRPNKMLV